jgi:cytochrome P450
MYVQEGEVMALTDPTLGTLRTPQDSHNIPLFGPLFGLMRDPLAFLRANQARHGDVYALNMGVTKIIMVNSPDHIQHTMVDSASNYTKAGAMWDSARRMMGEGMVVSEGEAWRSKRRMIQPHFHRKRLMGLTDLLVQSVDEAFEAWDSQIGKPFDVVPAFSPITMHVVMRLLFGQNLNRNEFGQVGGALSDMMNHVFWGGLTNGLPSWIPRPGAKRYEAASTLANDVVRRLIANQRAVGEGEDTLLALFVDSYDTETSSALSDIQLRDEIFGMFLAGYETTTLALAWVMHYLTIHPECKEKLYAEVDRVLGGRPPTFEDLAKLEYTRMLICETLRLRPPIWMITRTAVEADQIDGYHIPAGSLLFISFFNAQHHPQHWVEPERFMPERFTDDQVAARHRYAWSPFGAGQRMCVGKDLAMMEAQAILARIAQRFRIEAEPSTAIGKITGSIRPSKPIMITLQHRELERAVGA